MWTDTTRAQYARADLALPSDLTDAEWALLEPFFLVPCRVGRPRKWPLRRIVEAICVSAARWSRPARGTVRIFVCGRA
jgi:putative transposase